MELMIKKNDLIEKINKLKDQKPQYETNKENMSKLSRENESEDKMVSNASRINSKETIQWQNIDWQPQIVAASHFQ